MATCLPLKQSWDVNVTTEMQKPLQISIFPMPFLPRINNPPPHAPLHNQHLI